MFALVHGSRSQNHPLLVAGSTPHVPLGRMLAPSDRPISYTLPTVSGRTSLPLPLPRHRSSPPPPACPKAVAVASPRFQKSPTQFHLPSCPTWLPLPPMPNEAPQPYARGTWRAQPARWQGAISLNTFWIEPRGCQDGAAQAEPRATQPLTTTKPLPQQASRYKLASRVRRAGPWSPSPSSARRSRTEAATPCRAQRARNHPR